jgi:hypothetical protein
MLPPSPRRGQYEMSGMPTSWLGGETVGADRGFADAILIALGVEELA